MINRKELMKLDKKIKFLRRSICGNYENFIIVILQFLIFQVLGKGEKIMGMLIFKRGINGKINF